jgi:MATE family multidrug resistance protein
MEQPQAENVETAPHAENGNWWSRPCGVKEVLAMAAPLVISTASWSLMHFVDRMFLLWHSSYPLKR